MRRRISMILGLSVALLKFSGCNANRVSLVEEGPVSVAKRPSEKIDILWTDVYERDGQTWACGVLRQRASNSGAIKTHVDIQVLNSDGSIQYETIADDLIVPCNRVGKGIDYKRFKVRLPDKLPKDTQISMTVHSGRHKQMNDNSRKLMK